MQITLTQLARRLGVSRQYLHRMVQRGRVIPPPQRLEAGPAGILLFVPTARIVDKSVAVPLHK